MTTKGKKKNKKGPKKGGTKQQEDGQKKDLSIVKCFAYHKMGHYAATCPDKKKKKKQQTTASAEIDDFVATFQSEFSLCTGHIEREREHLFSPVLMLIDSGNFPW